MKPRARRIAAVVASVPEETKRIFSIDGIMNCTISASSASRAVTGRERLLKFAGAYHGHVDGLLAEAGSGLATGGIPASPGVPEAAAAAAGHLDERAAALESLTAIKRTGADLVVSYWTKELAAWL